MWSSALGLVVLTLAFTGACAWLRGHARIQTAFLPGLVLSGAGLIVFVSGLLGVLPYGVLAVVLVGLGLFVLEVVRDRSAVRSLVREPPMLMLAALVVAVSGYLHGALFLNYDNFSHWALVVRVMLEQDAFPDAQDTLVTFQSYPLGGASFVYLVARVVSPAESVMMAAQAALLCSYLVALYAFTRRRAIATIVVLGALLAFMTCGSAATGLLVDGLLAALTGWLIMLVLAERDDLTPALVPLGVGLTFLVTLKTSGLFFVLVVSVLVLTVLRTSGRLRGWRAWTSLALPWVALIVWNVHTRAAFESAAASKHALSVGRFRDVLAEKAAADVTEIVGAYGRAAFTDVVGLLLAVATLTATALLARAGVTSARWNRRVLVGALAALALYHVGNLAMYLLSMPLNEAQRLAGYARYIATFHLAWLLVVLALLLLAHDRAATLARRVVATVAGLVLLLVLPLTSSRYPVWPPPEGTDTTRDLLDTAVSDLEVRAGELVCVLAPAPAQSSYLAHMTRYELLHDAVEGRYVDEERHLPALDSCRHTILLTDNELALDYFAQQGLGVQGDPPMTVSR